MDINKKIAEIFRAEYRKADSLATAASKYRDSLRDGKQSDESSQLYDALAAECKHFLDNSEVEVKPVINTTVVKADWYPLSGPIPDRILAILKHEGRAMRSPKVEEMIEKIEGRVLAEKTLKSFWYQTKQLLKKDALVSHQLNNNRWYNFLALPEWLEGNKLPEDRYPAEESWGNIPQSERTFKNKAWKGGSKA